MRALLFDDIRSRHWPILCDIHGQHTLQTFQKQQLQSKRFNNTDTNTCTCLPPCSESSKASWVSSCPASRRLRRKMDIKSTVYVLSNVFSGQSALLQRQRRFRSEDHREITEKHLNTTSAYSYIILLLTFRAIWPCISPHLERIKCVLDNTGGPPDLAWLHAPRKFFKETKLQE